MKFEKVDVYAATHVKLHNGEIQKIKSKYGVGPERVLAPPSKGGFGVITESGEKVSMWDADSYLQEEEDDKDV